MPFSPPTLLECCLSNAAKHISSYSSLDGVAEELVLVLFNLTLERGALTEKVLSMFLATNHDSLLKRIADLHLKDPPPLIRTGEDRWLHERPGWY
jgi:hypothetical protein